MNHNDYVAGGYLPNSSPRAGSQSSPGGERKAAAQALRPLTIKQILNAEQAHQDAEVYIDGVEVGQLTVIGQVLSIQVQVTNSVYYIDDGTGRIEARLWTDSSASEDEERNDFGIKEQTYVRVTGGLKHFGNKRYINASAIRPSTDPHELYHHFFEVMYVNTVHLKGPPPKPGQQNGHALPNGSTMNGTSNYSAYTSTTNTVGGLGDQYSGLTPLARRIMEFIVNEPPKDEGVHVAAIARHVKADAAAISTALDELMDSGHVFSTIDESHFAASG